jgi:SpoIID/LytB domain protein
MVKNARLSAPSQKAYQSAFRTDDELIRWYDREDHLLFDVCADDHCQRYQGVTRASTPLVTEVVQATRGEVLAMNGEICDTRFSKCCGGVTEKFENVWEPLPHSYLTALADSPEPELPDLTQESEADNWIRTSPPSFCNTRDKDILSQALNNYDRETTDFYRWKVVYSQKELAELINRKTGIDFGEIIDLIPLKRGTSARIERLRIVGTHRTCIIGKELEIRRTLSETHLYSSAFVIDKEPIGESIVPACFILTGAGWGHGVGLCQIGAAVMGAQGHNYTQILSHYYPGAEIEKRY